MAVLRPLLTAIALGSVLVGCGSSGGDGGGASSEPSTVASAGASQDAGSSAEPVPSASIGGGGGGIGSSDIPDFADGPWKAGSAHVEVSGDKSMTIDATIADGIGHTAEGFTDFGFTDPLGTTTVQMSLANPASDGAFGFSTPELATSIPWDGGCTIKVTKYDGSGVAGEFACDDIDAISTTVAETYRIDVTGTFEVAR